MVSRILPPNAYQVCNPHHDNNSWQLMKKLLSGLAPDDGKLSRAGFENSQRPGSCAMVCSRGTQPMMMTFSYRTPHLPITQSTKEYVSMSLVFSMK